MTLHQRLKKATDAIHIRLEKELNLLRDDLTITDYIELLKRCFYRPLENHFPYQKDREKTHLLIQDLSSFGIKDLSQISLFSSFPEHADKSFLMGVTY